MREHRPPLPFLSRVVPLAVLLAVCVPAPPAEARPQVLSVEQWRADLHALAERLPQVHRNAFHAISRDSFDREVADLDRGIPELTDAGVIVGLAAIVASIGDGHTRLTLPQEAAVSLDRGHTPTPAPAESALVFHQLPIRLYLYRDGLHVRAATGTYARLAGARVDSIGGMSAEQALEAVRPVVARDNESGFKRTAPMMLEIPEVLAARGIVRGPQRARFVVTERGGGRIALEIPPLAGAAPGAWVEARAPGVTAPLWERHPRRPFWFEALPDRHALYAQVNAVANGSEESLAAFTRRLLAAADAPGTDRLVLDLRRNGGGDNTLVRALVLGLCRSAKVDRPGRLFVIVGRVTFSAAVNLTSDLQYWTNALFVGEPTGGSPSGYGDARKFQLPNSGLTVRASTIYWRDWSPSEDRPWIAPDLAAEPTSEDQWRGRDPVLEAALDWPAKDSIAATVRELLARGDEEGAALAYFRYRYDPATVQVPVEQGMLDLGRALLAERRIEPALGVFSLLARDQPRSAAAAEGLGDACAAAGKAADAGRHYRRALELEPKRPGVQRKLEALGAAGS